MENKLQILFLLLIVIVLVIFSFTVFTLIKNLELLKKEPIKYGMEINHYNSCLCFNEFGTVGYGINQTEYQNKTDSIISKQLVIFSNGSK